MIFFHEALLWTAVGGSLRAPVKSSGNIELVLNYSAEPYRQGCTPPPCGRISVSSGERSVPVGLKKLETNQFAELLERVCPFQIDTFYKKLILFLCWHWFVLSCMHLCTNTFSQVKSVSSQSYTKENHIPMYWTLIEMLLWAFAETWTCCCA